jgi:Pyridoxamine 5'-phosphate oxidase
MTVVFTHGESTQRLDVGECRRLLATEALGRVAVSVGALPLVVPVLYRVAEEQVLFEVEKDARLYAALANNIVAFEVDHVDIASHQGWTVLVIGRSRPTPESPSGSPKDQPTLEILSTRQQIGITLDRLSGLRATRTIPSGLDSSNQ